MAEAIEAGVATVIDIGMGTEESAAAALRAEELAPHVYATVGVHPNDLEEFGRDPNGTISFLRDLCARERVVGVGETGLDHYRDRSDPRLQEEAFRAHIALAQETNLALVVHCRDAHDRLLEVLADAGLPDRVVMHCFSGDSVLAERCADLGYFCSFAGNLTYKRSDELRDAARTVPPKLLLVETDAPFLAPHPFRGKPNKPALLRHTVEELASARSTPVDELVELIRDNAIRAFGLDESRTLVR